MKTIDIQGMTNMELVRGGTNEWYWATDYIHGDLYEAEELFRQGHSVWSNRLYLIHYPDGTVYEPVKPTDGQYLGAPVYDGNSVVLLVVSFIESAIRILRFLHQQGEVQEIAQLPLSVVKDCYIEYISPQYIAIGSPDDFVETTIDSVNVGIAESHPSTQIDETHFVIEVGPVRLKWIM